MRKRMRKLILGSAADGMPLSLLRLPADRQYAAGFVCAALLLAVMLVSCGDSTEQPMPETGIEEECQENQEETQAPEPDDPVEPDMAERKLQSKEIALALNNPAESDVPQRDPDCWDHSEQKIIDYLKSFGYERVTRWVQAPVLNIGAGTDRNVEHTEEAVRLLNEALLEELRITVGDRVSPPPPKKISETGITLPRPDVPDGHIYIDFETFQEGGPTTQRDDIGWTDGNGLAWTFGDNNPARVIDGAYVIVGTNYDCSSITEKRIILHELIHALGFSGHSRPREMFGNQTIMAHGGIGSGCDTSYEEMVEIAATGLYPVPSSGTLWEDFLCGVLPRETRYLPHPDPLLPTLDRDGLRALYTMDAEAYFDDFQQEGCVNY